MIKEGDNLSSEQLIHKVSKRPLKPVTVVKHRKVYSANGYNFSL